jgi:hypothetical protein
VFLGSKEEACGVSLQASLLVWHGTPQKEADDVSLQKGDVLHKVHKLGCQNGSSGFSVKSEERP